MQTKKLSIYIALIFSVQLSAQIESSNLSFSRGKLWQSVSYGKVAPVFANWGRKGISLDWPGFDESRISVDIGGPASHMVSGGFFVGARKNLHPDSIIAVEDWAMSGGTISTEPGAKYIVKKHTYKYGRTGNYGLVKNPLEGEDVIETIWEANLNYSNVDDRDNQMPLRVRRLMMQWSGSKSDENYIIYQYTFKNISNEIKAIDPLRPIADTLYDFYAMLVYGLQNNSRSWKILNPSLTEGNRNTDYWLRNPGDNTDRLIIAKSTSTPNPYSALLGPLSDAGTPTGEWLAPGYVGLDVLYSSNDTTGKPTPMSYNKNLCWSVASNSIDLSGPLTSVGQLRAKYGILQNPKTAASTAYYKDAVFNASNNKSRMWTLYSIGPFHILPGDSVVIAIAEIVDGVDYTDALGPKPLYNGSYSIFENTVKKARFTYNQYVKGHGFNHPDPPQAPKFTVDYNKLNPELAANVITWSDANDDLPDPDDGIQDLAGYRLYRSNYMPFGPWKLISEIKKKTAPVYDAANHQYVFADSTAPIGVSFYYALTAYDEGRATPWKVDPSVTIPGAKPGLPVPPLESSIFANRMNTQIVTTFAPKSNTNEIIVVPNPYVRGSKTSSIGNSDSEKSIQFINIPNPCTIRIYTVRGDHIKTLEAPEGSGAIMSWNLITDYGQYAESGMYIYRAESSSGTRTGKFAIVK
ncbi:MAG: hypothetical protein HYV28_17255 [Ignavibacteriales bacterium]|nr:hypothetical protein [Ignavibacteriales bacterium]